MNNIAIGVEYLQNLLGGGVDEVTPGLPEGSHDKIDEAHLLKKGGKRAKRKLDMKKRVECYYSLGNLKGRHRGRPARKSNLRRRQRKELNVKTDFLNDLLFFWGGLV